MPRDSKALWDWLVAQDEATRQNLLAFCLAVSVDALVPARPSSALRPSDPAQAGRLAATLALDMATWWRPIREGFLDRASKAQIIAAVAEAAGEAKVRSLDGLKKAALAELAEPILTPAHWLPETLRTPSGEATAEAAHEPEPEQGLRAARAWPGATPPVRRRAPTLPRVRRPMTNADQ